MKQYGQKTLTQEYNKKGEKLNHKRTPTDDVHKRRKGNHNLLQQDIKQIKMSVFTQRETQWRSPRHRFGKCVAGIWLRKADRPDSHMEGNT